MVDGNKKVILIVDDDENTRQMYVDLFRTNGFKVLEAKDGLEGLDMATRHEGIDVIFTGVIMPRMDGFQMMQALKENASTVEIPVVINSHLGREEDRKRAQELGARDFIIRGIISPADVVKRLVLAFSLEGKEYMLKIDPYELDAQLLIEDIALPKDFGCKNCGSPLAIKFVYKPGEHDLATIMCPNCKEEY